MITDMAIGYNFEKTFFFMKNPTLHCVAFSIFFKADAIDEPISGINHLVEHLFTCFGDTDDKKRFYQSFEKLGVDFISTVNREGIYFSFCCLPENFEKSLLLVKELLMKRTFSEEAFLREKDIILTEISEYYHNDYDFCLTSSNSSLLGDKANLESITFLQAIEYMKRIFCKEKAYIFLAGNYSDANEAFIKSLFDYLPNIGKIMPANEVQRRTIKKVNYKYSKSDELTIRLAFNCTDIPFECLDILDMMLFYPGSGIFMFILREELGLIYNLDSEIRFDGKKTLLVCDINIDKKHAVKTMKIISDTLKNLNFLLTDDLLKCCLPFRSCNLDFLYDDPLLWIKHCINDFDNDVITIEEEKSKYNSIRRIDLVNYSKKFSFDNCIFMFEGKLNIREKKQLNVLCNKE